MNLKKKSMSYPQKAGFLYNNGVWIMTMEMNLHYRIDKNLIPAGRVAVLFMDHDPIAKSSDSILLNAGIWKPYECGWLWASFQESSIFLAKVTPAEKRAFESSDISVEKGLILPPLWT